MILHVDAIQKRMMKYCRKKPNAHTCSIFSPNLDFLYPQVLPGLCFASQHALGQPGILVPDRQLFWQKPAVCIWPVRCLVSSVLGRYSGPGSISQSCWKPLGWLECSLGAVRERGDAQQLAGWSSSSCFKAACHECPRLREKGQWCFPVLVPRRIKGSGTSGSLQKPLTHHRSINIFKGLPWGAS